MTGAGARSRSGALSIAPAGESGAVAPAILLANMSAGAGLMGEVALYHWEPNANLPSIHEMKESQRRVGEDRTAPGLRTWTGHPQ